MDEIQVYAHILLNHDSNGDILAAEALKTYKTDKHQITLTICFQTKFTVFVIVKMVCRNFGRGFNSRQLHQS